MKNLEFKELNAQELEEVNGGVAPLIVGGLILRAYYYQRKRPTNLFL